MRSFRYLIHDATFLCFLLSISRGPFPSILQTYSPRPPSRISLSCSLCFSRRRQETSGASTQPRRGWRHKYEEGPRHDDRWLAGGSSWWIYRSQPIFLRHPRCLHRNRSRDSLLPGSLVSVFPSPRSLLVQLTLHGCPSNRASAFALPVAIQHRK